ncbi:MAG: carbohydrate-binding protein [Aquificales bacterium]|nr:carbohydrate-binding protein [Aquificales bacterium]
MLKLLHHLFKPYQSNKKKTQGQGLVEYALILGFAALAIIAIVQLMRPAIEDTFSTLAGNAPIAPPSLLSYTPPPTYTTVPTLDPLATSTPVPSATNTVEATNTATATSTATQTPTATATPICIGYGPYNVPGRVQAETFACGGSNVAFVDSTGDGGPGSGAYRQDVTTEGPDLGNVTGGYYVGWIVPNEWIIYDIDAQNSQIYDLSFRAASSNSNGRFRMEIVHDGQVVHTTSSIAVPNTGGDQVWANFPAPSIPLIGGVSQIIIVFENGGFNLDYFDASLSALPTATNTVMPTNIPTATPTPTNTPTPTSTPTATATPGAVCRTYNSNNVPRNISSRNTPEVFSRIDVGDAGAITDVNVLNLRGEHTWMNDLDFNLINPRGVEVQIMTQSCYDLDDFDLNLDDEVAPGSWPCPPTDGGTYQPSGRLADFDGEESQGRWWLRIDDNADNDGGKLLSWSLEICTQ